MRSRRERLERANHARANQLLRFANVEPGSLADTLKGDGDSLQKPSYSLLRICSSSPRRPVRPRPSVSLTERGAADREMRPRMRIPLPLTSRFSHSRRKDGRKETEGRRRRADERSTDRASDQLMDKLHPSFTAKELLTDSGPTPS